MRIKAVEWMNRFISIPPWVWKLPQEGFRYLSKLLINSPTPLYVSTIFSEFAGYMVYVVLVEKAFELGEGAVGVGRVLIIQAITQLVLGTWAGSLSDRIGSEKAYVFGLFGQAFLAGSLAFSQSLTLLYVLALTLMLARLVILTARTAIVAQVSTRSNLIRVNTAVSVFSGLGFFLGPAIAAWLMIGAGDSRAILFGASLVLVLTALIPLDTAPRRKLNVATQRINLREQISTAWDLIAHHRTIWQVLMCLVISILTTGAIFPLLPNLARRFGFGPEGTGVFFSALGLGTLFGPLFAGILLNRLGLSPSLLLTAFLTPLAILSVGLFQNLLGVLAALFIAALASASLNVIVITIIQRLTPPSKRGNMFGAKEAIIGLTWIFSLAVITGLTSVGFGGIGSQDLFIGIGTAGVLMLVWCLFIRKRDDRGIHP